ncbi:uncharacterized protein V1510DRAFT_315569 [Dipodascopsis tothii]|uniref:uncharacterized protein n=1 Tax=Dipodascopsis tothii TaxID=44089 RepID=UPI0034CDBBA2
MDNPPTTADLHAQFRTDVRALSVPADADTLPQYGIGEPNVLAADDEVVVVGKATLDVVDTLTDAQRQLAAGGPADPALRALNPNYNLGRLNEFANPAGLARFFERALPGVAVGDGSDPAAFNVYGSNYAPETWDPTAYLTRKPSAPKKTPGRVDFVGGGREQAAGEPAAEAERAERKRDRSRDERKHDERRDGDRSRDERGHEQARESRRGERGERDRHGRDSQRDSRDSRRERDPDPGQDRDRRDQDLGRDRDRRDQDLGRDRDQDHRDQDPGRDRDRDRRDRVPDRRDRVPDRDRGPRDRGPRDRDRDRARNRARNRPPPTH